MLRMKYKIYNNQQPIDTIIATVPTIDQFNDLFLGQFPDGTGWIYGEIDTDPANLAALQAALVNWQATFFANDADALSHVDAIVPAGTVLQPKITYDAASIDPVTSKLVKTTTTYP